MSAPTVQAVYAKALPGGERQVLDPDGGLDVRTGGHRADLVQVKKVVG
jgi:hypothetical protein